MLRPVREPPVAVLPVRVGPHLAVHQVRDERNELMP